VGTGVLPWGVKWPGVMLSNHQH